MYVQKGFGGNKYYFALEQKGLSLSAKGAEGVGFEPTEGACDTLTRFLAERNKPDSANPPRPFFKIDTGTVGFEPTKHAWSAHYSDYKSDAISHSATFPRPSCQEAIGLPRCAQFYHNPEELRNVF